MVLRFARRMNRHRRPDWAECGRCAKRSVFRAGTGTRPYEKAAFFQCRGRTAPPPRWSPSRPVTLPLGNRML